MSAARTKSGRIRGFDRTNPFGCKTTYICSSCGKRTRETGESESGVGLCLKCFTEAGLENEHSDYGHKEFDENCPTCRWEREMQELGGQATDVPDTYHGEKA